VRAEREVVNRRVFAAPAARVFKAFSDPAQLAQWFGPDGFTNTIHQHDFQPGGEWKYTMHGPDGVDFFNESLFLDIVDDARVVIDHLRPMHRFTLTIAMDEDDGQTALVWRQAFATEEALGSLREFLYEPTNRTSIVWRAFCASIRGDPAKLQLLGWNGRHTLPHQFQQEDDD
jgi:uncharacterized protein YndB with AHSA1/START domain